VAKVGTSNKVVVFESQINGFQKQKNKNGIDFEVVNAMVN
jgi:hypothetical protein